MRRAPRPLAALASMTAALALVACSAAQAPESGGRAAPAPMVKEEQRAQFLPKGVDWPYPAVIPPDDKEKDPTKYKYGGTFNYTSLDPPHLDMALSASCTVYNINDMVYNKMIRVKAGAHADVAKIELEGDLAKSWDISSDAKVFTFKLHEGVKWQNLPPVSGRELTAQDILYSYERYATTGVQRSIFTSVEKMEALDKYTVRITLKEPYVDFIGAIASQSYIVPKELVDAGGGNLRQKAIGTGPFILDEWVPKQGSKFRKNPDYFEKGLPYIDFANAFIIPDAAVARAAYRSGQTDVVSAGRLISDAEELQKQVPDSVIQASINPRGNTNAIQFRLDKAPFNDVRVRRAISMALNRKAYADTLNEGRVFQNMGFPWPYVFDQWPSLEEWGPYYQYNPTEAKRLLAEAGFPNGISFNLVDWYHRDRADVFIALWKENGVNITRREVDNPTHVEMLNNRRFEEATGAVWGIPAYEVDGEIYPWYHSKGAKNFDYVNDPELDKLLEAQRRELDPAKRKTILKQIWDRLNDQVYQIWLPSAGSNNAWRGYVKNFRNHQNLGTTSCYMTGALARVLWLDK